MVNIPLFAEFEKYPYAKQPFVLLVVSFWSGFSQLAGKGRILVPSQEGQV